MDVQAYLDRIGFQGVPRPDLATLRALHRGHALAISYENLDVQLGRPMTTDPAAAFDKLVHGRRGGWCYEMNGVLGAVLSEIGFKVTRLAGGAYRASLCCPMEPTLGRDCAQTAHPTPVRRSSRLASDPPTAPPIVK